MIRVVIAALVLLAVPSAAAEQDRFDLICTGEGVTVRYRVDLARNEACSDSCDRVWKMGEPTSGELKLIDRRPAYFGDLEERATVNRQTGEYRYYMALGRRRGTRESGTCQPAPFTGFPAAKF